MREGKGSNKCIHETTKFMLCQFQEVFQQIMVKL